MHTLGNFDYLTGIILVERMGCAPGDGTWKPGISGNALLEVANAFEET